VVDGLVPVGMNLLRTLDPASGPASVRDAFLAYCRISRALRLTVLIEMPLATLADEGAPAALAAQRAAQERDRQDLDKIAQALSRPMAEIAAAATWACRAPRPARSSRRSPISSPLIANDDADAPEPAAPGLAAAPGARRRDAVRHGPGWNGRDAGRLRTGIRASARSIITRSRLSSVRLIVITIISRHPQRRSQKGRLCHLNR
jgi:hypothetical protein